MAHPSSNGHAVATACRRCTKCRQPQPLSEYHLSKGRPKSRCRTCENAACSERKRARQGREMVPGPRASPPRHAMLTLPLGDGLTIQVDPATGLPSAVTLCWDRFLEIVAGRPAISLHVQPPIPEESPAEGVRPPLARRGRGGPLTRPDRETLHALIRENPRRPDAWIAKTFTGKTSRALQASTVATHRAAVARESNGRASDHANGRDIGRRGRLGSGATPHRGTASIRRTTTSSCSGSRSIMAHCAAAPGTARSMPTGGSASSRRPASSTRVAG